MAGPNAARMLSRWPYLVASGLVLLVLLAWVGKNYNGPAFNDELLRKWLDALTSVLQELVFHSYYTV